MSFDVYLIPFANGESSGIPREAVRAAFGEHVRWDEDGEGWTRYDDTNRDDGCRIGLSSPESDPNLVSFIALNRPVGDRRLWEVLYRIMRLGHIAMVYPGYRGPLIADPAAAAHLPASLLEEQRAIVVNSGEEISEQIRSS